MYPLFDKLKSSCQYVTEVQEISKIWDKRLKKTRSDVYLTIPEKPAVVMHVFLTKLKLANWSAEEARSEGPSKIWVGVFTPSSKEQRARTMDEVHDVEMDSVLNQPKPQQSTIRKILRLDS